MYNCPSLPPEREGLYLVSRTDPVPSVPHITEHNREQCYVCLLGFPANLTPLATGPSLSLNPIFCLSRAARVDASPQENEQPGHLLQPTARGIVDLSMCDMAF